MLSSEPGASVTPPPEPTSCGIYSLDDIPSAPRGPSVSTEWHEGASGFRRAAEEQASSGAPLLLLFHVEWCPHCRRFINEVIPSAELRALGERIIKVKLNPEVSSDDRELAGRFSVTSYPSLFVITSTGHPPVRLTRWGSPQAFTENCERALSTPARTRLDKGISLSRGGSPEQAAAELKAAAGDPRVAAVALDHLGLLVLAHAHEALANHASEGCAHRPVREGLPGQSGAGAGGTGGAGGRLALSVDPLPLVAADSVLLEQPVIAPALRLRAMLVRVGRFEVGLGLGLAQRGALDVELHEGISPPDHRSAIDEGADHTAARVGGDVRLLVRDQ